MASSRARPRGGDIHIINQIRRSLEKFIETAFQTFEQSETRKIKNVFDDTEAGLKRLQRQSNELYEDFNHISEPDNREEVIEGLFTIQRQLTSINDEFKKWEDYQTEFERKIKDQGDEFTEKKKIFQPSFDEAIEIVRNLEDVDILLPGQVLRISPRTASEEQIRQVYEALPWLEYREIKQEQFAEFTERKNAWKKDYEDRFKLLKKKFIKFVEGELNIIIDSAYRFKMRSSPIFVETVEQTKEIGINISIEEETPSFQDDIFYANFLQAISDHDLPTLMSIAVELASDNPEIYDMDFEQLEDYLNENFFS